MITSAQEAMQANERYFGLSDVSGSDLSWLNHSLRPNSFIQDYTDAYRMGSLIDAMITEPSRINYYKYQLDGNQYTPDEFALCERMKKAFRNDELCVSLLRQSTGQMVMRAIIEFSYLGFDFALSMRCKYDLWSDVLKWGGDLKSTTATTEKQFRDAIMHFDYDRQRATYMSISGAEKDIIIGISKVNYKIFMVPIEKGDEIWSSGYEKLSNLAFRWWTLFEGI